LNIDVVRLPEIITPQYVKSINTHPGILSLGLRKTFDPKTGSMVIRGTPFVVPGGRFNEMYGWDSYFEALGLLTDSRVELARAMVDNFAYEIEHYGKILNANRSYYLTRSQPPFLTDMINQVYKQLKEKVDKMGHSSAGIDTPIASHSINNHRSLQTWLSQSTRAAVKELFSIWKSSPRLDPIIGLSKYYPEGLGMPPETESTHFQHILSHYAEKHGVNVNAFTEMYTLGQVHEPELDEYFVHDRAGNPI
jgi:alpha,alpha-trehalase